MGRVLLALVFSVFLGVMPAKAGSILLFDDFSFSSNPYSTASTNLGHTVSSVASEAAFIAGLASGTFDLAIFSENNFTYNGAQTALATYVAGGGRAIHDTWDTTSAAVAAFAASYNGTANHSSLTITDAALLAGLSGGTQTLTNPGYGIFSLGYSVLAGGTVAGTFNDSSAGIIIANDGRTILNGNLDETFVSLADEIKFYENEISLVLAGGTRVPEPGTLALFGFGLLGLGALARRRAI